MLTPRSTCALLVAFSLLTGCVSVRRVGTEPIEGEGGGVAVQVYADDAARRAGVPSPRFVVGELERFERPGERSERPGWQPVFRSLNPAWTILDLPPGKYRVRFPAVLDAQGNEVRNNDEGRTFRVQEGEVVQLEATLEHKPRALIAAGVVTAVVAGVLLHEWLDDHDLPTPPIPEELLVDVAFTLTLDLAFRSAMGPRAPIGRPPVVTSHFPEDGTLVAARRVRLIFALSEPLDGDLLPLDSVEVRGENVGIVAGEAFYDPENWWVVWEPDEDLPRDEVLEATLYPESVVDLGGYELAGPVTFSIRTTQ